MSQLSLNDLFSQKETRPQAASGPLRGAGGIRLPLGPNGRVYFLKVYPALSGAAAQAFPSPSNPNLVYLEFDGTTLKLHDNDGTVLQSWE